LRYLDDLGVARELREQWYRHWVGEGLAALEAMLANDRRTGWFCHGDLPGLADCCLIPQLFNARRNECGLSAYPTLRRIEDACRELPAFQSADPARQPDAE